MIKVNLALNFEKIYPETREPNIKPRYTRDPRSPNSASLKFKFTFMMVEAAGNKP